MKLRIYCTAVVFATAGLIGACKYASVQKNGNDTCVIQTDTEAIASKMLTLANAEKIMGEAARLSCNTYAKKGDTLEYKCDYTATSEDAITLKTGKLYFMYEVYASEAGAKNAYTSIFDANRSHQGIEVVPGLGDEAYYHTDGSGFYFFLVRKKEKLYRMKLNKVTSHSSEEAFKVVGKEIAESM